MNTQQQQNRIDMKIEPKSDQINYDDFIGGTKTITITNVTGSSNKEQPVNIHYDGDSGKPFRPCKTMRRLIVHVWGDTAKEYVGKSMTLYGDGDVLWGGKKVGGIRISHMSHIDQEITVPLTKSRAQRVPFTIKPLKINMVDQSTSNEDVEEYADLYDRACEQAENGMSYYKDFFGALSKADKTRLKDSGDHDKLKVLAEAVEKDPEY